MYIRIKQTPRSQSISVQLVESFREKGKIKQRVLRHVGTASSPQKIEELKRLALVIKTELQHQNIYQHLVDATSHYASVFGNLLEVPEKLLLHAAYLEESQRHIVGIHDIYGYIYDYLGFSNLFSNPARRVHAAKILRDVVLARIAFPKSKRASVEFLAEKFGLVLELEHVYQMMDKMDDHFFNKIQQAALGAALKLSGGKLRILFYDATTLYFESFTEDELKSNGYSKDLKFNQPQVVLALFVTEYGLPVGYELFPGNTFEGHTLIPALEKLRERYLLEDVIFVADRGLFNEENLKLLESKNFKYVVGAKIKNLSKTLEKEVLNLDNYHSSQLDFKTTRSQQEKSKHSIATFAYHEGRRLIVHYSEKRAKKDAYDRQKSIEKLYKKMMRSQNPKSLLNNFGYKKYLEVEGNAKLSINQSKIEEASRWDGLAGIVTNIKDTRPEELLTHYRGLYQIEECFRINKHDLRMRPIFHWKPHRVKAHIAIAFMAFVCVKYLEYRMKTQSAKVSPEEIRKALLCTQATVFHDKKLKQQFLLPSKVNPIAKEIYRVMRIKSPKKILAIKKL